MPGAARGPEAAARRGPAHSPTRPRSILPGLRALLVAALGVGAHAQTPEPPAESAGPEEIRARERMVLLGISTVMMAEKMYAAANGALFGDIKCLTRPAECLPDRDPNAATFLDPTADWLETRLGFAQKFYPGPVATEEQIRKARAAPGSLTSFAFTATPLKPGVTGRRGFCADSTGKICFTADGREPPVRNGRCDPCKKLE